jgi:hypothetical protein
MVVEEVVSFGFFDKLKEAIGGVVFGLALFVIAFPVLFWMEGRAIKRERALEGGQAAAIEVASDKVDAANDKKLLVTNGLATTDEELTDSKFGVSATALKIKRDVEMYQWEEEKKTKTKNKKKTTTYSYKKVWSSRAIDTSGFKEQKDPNTGEVHANTGPLPYEEFSTAATTVTMGAFTLNSGQVSGINNWKPLAPSAIPASLGASGSNSGTSTSTPTDGKTCPQCNKTLKSPAGLTAHMKDTGHKAGTAGAASGSKTGGASMISNGFYIGGSESSPKIGDVRVTFQQVPPTDVTILAQQTGNTFEAYKAGTDDELNDLKLGKLTKQAMFAALAADNKMMLWIGRIAGWIMMMLGLFMIFKPVAVVADVIPIFGSIVGAGLGLAAAGLGSFFALSTIAVGWVFYRPLIGIPLLLLAVGLLVGLIMMGKKAAAAKAAAGGGGEAAPEPAAG